MLKLYTIKTLPIKNSIKIKYSFKDFTTFLSLDLVSAGRLVLGLDIYKTKDCVIALAHTDLFRTILVQIQCVLKGTTTNAG